MRLEQGKHPCFFCIQLPATGIGYNQNQVVDANINIKCSYKKGDTLRAQNYFR